MIGTCASQVKYYVNVKMEVYKSEIQHEDSIVCSNINNEIHEGLSKNTLANVYNDHQNLFKMQLSRKTSTESLEQQEFNKKAQNQNKNITQLRHKNGNSKNYIKIKNVSLLRDTETNSIKSIDDLKSTSAIFVACEVQNDSKQNLSTSIDRINIDTFTKEVDGKVKSAKPVLGAFITANDKTINSLNAVVRHKKSERSRYYCRECTFDQKLTVSQLREHYGMEHAIPASVINRAFVQRCMSKNPRATLPNYYKCEICSIVLDTKEQLNLHYATHEDQFTCDICDIGFKRHIDYIIHAQTHSEDKLYRCTLCEVTMEKLNSIKQHLYYRHEHFRKFECEICGKKFNIYRYLLEHMNIHTGAKPFQCEKCGSSFALLNYLKQHISKTHSNQSKDTQCPICGKVYASKLSMKIHCREIHQPPKRCICDICGKEFAKSSGLSAHRVIHTEHKLHKCSYCEKSFVKKGTKREHERIHTGEKPFVCPYCEKGFSQRSAMVRHSRMHREAGIYICYSCNHKFYFKHEIIRHFETHCRRL